MAAALGLSACAVGPDYQRPAVRLENQWQHGNAPGDERQLSDWWQQFDDPRLTQLLQQGRDNNPTLASAAVRIAQAQAQLGIAKSGELPAVQLSLSRNYSKPDLANQLQGKTGGGSTQQISLQAAWEPDLWGAVRRGGESAQASWLSTIAAYQAAMAALEANIATLYFNVRTLEQRLLVASNNLKQQAENLRIANARFRAGASSEQDLRQAQVLFEQTNANIPTLRAALQQSQHALSVLLGQPPDYYRLQYADAVPMPSVPASVPAGIPRDLLQRRPDVLQAEYAAIAQSARIGQAKAALFPSFSLGGSFGYQSSDSGGNHLSDLFKWHNPVTSASAGFLLPIFNHGLLVNQVRVEDAAFQQAVLNYQNQVLTAQQQVEDALSAIDGHRAARLNLTTASNAARRSTLLALERYKAGETDFTTVTSAYQSQLQVEDGLAQAEGNLLQSFVEAYRALGGGWDGKLTAELSEDITRQMRARTDWGDALELPHSQGSAP
ncbi:efflux transporter outer membrane subunit [Paludibacterium purpuratum]|uniref:efflux transporter outer membrane subunit n=1 Tax=Paludibacterium purpuratum TaxID=1144873 RepID=UPI00141530CA|nr:efflux transporter outer membrane subunit [Paludibacterium purpuratum]